MSATTSVMLRGASKRLLSLTEIIGNNGTRLIGSTKSSWGSKTASFSTRASMMDQGFLVPDSSSSRSVNFSTSTPKVPEPQPLVAVAYEYDDDEVDDSSADEAHDSTNNSFTQKQDTTKISAVGVTSASKSDVNYVISCRNSTSSGAVEKLDSMEHSSITSNSPSFSPDSKFNTIFNSIHSSSASTTTANNNNGSGIGDGDGNNTINAPYPPPSSAELEGEAKGFRKGSGGGGGGRYRCPKCGTDVTFKCDFEDNTFYCASCAGWFAGRSPVDAATRAPRQQDASYEEFIAKDMRNNPHKSPGGPVSEQEIIMRHVSYRFKVKIVLVLAGTL